MPKTERFGTSREPIPSAVGKEGSLHPSRAREGEPAESREAVFSMRTPCYTGGRFHWIEVSGAGPAMAGGSKALI